MKEQQGLPASGQQLHHFSNYDLIRRIDVGGMGEVYLAHQRTAFNRKVAVKIIRSDLVHDTVARKRFLREAEVSAHLKHEHILPLFEFGEEQGRLFIVTPYIEGGTLSRHLQSGPLSLLEVHQLFTALVQAIAYIHKRGVIHRDLKPSNILLDRADDNDQVYVRLIDFGIASLQGKMANPAMTIGGQEMGTLAYLAPERLDGIAAPSNDIYSLGVILYQMLTGELPGESGFISLPPALDTIVRRSTAINPAERYPTADDLLKAFEGTYRYLSSVRPVQLPVTSELTATQPEVDDSPTPGRVVETPQPVSTGKQPIVAVEWETSSQVASEDEPPSDPQPALPAQRGAKPAARSTIRPVLQAGQSTPTTTKGNTAEMPALPMRQPVGTGTRSKPPRAPDEELVVLSALTEQRPLKRAGMLVHTQDQAGFTRQDYEAPTSHLDPALVGAKQVQGKKTNAKTDASAPTEPKIKKSVISKAQRRSLLAFIPLVIIVLLLFIGGVAYLSFQASIKANIEVTPQAHSLSQVFTLKARLNQGASGTQIPAFVLSKTRNGSMSGATTGRTNCTLFILGCKKAVSSFDVAQMASQLAPGLQKQIWLDLQNQARTNGAQMMGSVVFTDNAINSDPGVGTQSPTVTVTLTEQGSVEYFKKGDAVNAAKALLQDQVRQKFGANYALLDQYTQVGNPSVQSINSTDGTVTLTIAAGGIASYQLPSDELSTIKSHVKGLTMKAAHSYVSHITGIDPASASIHLSYGETIPTGDQQITVNTLSPNINNLLPINLPKVPAGIPFTPPF